MLAAPLAVSAPKQHATEIVIAGGSGSYAVITRGCEGQVLSKYRIHYDNAAYEVSHKFPSVVRIGVRGGVLNLEGGEATEYVNPFLSMDWSGFSIGGGWVHGDTTFPDQGGETFNGRVSGHMRIGRSKRYFSVGFFEDLPLATAGYFSAGFGGGGRKLHVWAGTGYLPYDNWGFVTRVDYRLTGGLVLGGTGRLGGSEGVSESAFGIRLSYQWRHGAEPQPPPAPVTPPDQAPLPKAMPQEAPADSTGRP